VLHETLAFLLLVILAVLGVEAQKRLARRGIRAPAMEGLVWLALGALVGDAGLGLFPEDILAGLRAVVLVGLAWLGLVYGLQMDATVILRLKPWHRGWGLGLPSAVAALLFAVALAAGVDPAAAAGMAAVGAVSSTTSLDALARMRRPDDRGAVRILRMVAAFSGLPAMLLLAVADLRWSPLSSAGGGWMPWWQVAVVALGGAVVLGYALLALIRGIRSSLELLTLLLGFAALAAGGAAVLGISAVPLAALAGAVIINRCFFPHRILKVAHGFERPLMVMMLVLVGATLQGVSFSWRAFALLVLVRGAALAVGGRLLAGRAKRAGAAVSPWIGLGLLPQEALALGLVVAVDVAGGVDGLLGAAVLAMVVNQVAAQLWMRRALFPSGERGEPR
jgi:hypothetical protein